MKKLILILLLFVSANFAQTSTILLLFDDAGSMPITFTGTSTGNITLQGTGVIVVDWGDGSKNSYTLTGSDQNISHNYGSAGTRNIKIDKPKLITKWRQSDATNTWAWDTKYLPNLTYLHLESIKGAMVVNTANMTSLTYLYLNSLNTGTISITVNTANITSLTYLYLNSLNTGTISITVNTANITSLTSLALHYLNTGTISITVNTANITSLTYLSLYYLNTGTISITVNTANITSLTSLYLYNLNTGTISITVNTANITSLTSLALHNLNTGTISITVNTANMTSLTYLSLYYLNTGTISITVNTANMTSLTYLSLYYLNTGTISITVNTANITSLTYLYLNSLNTGTRSLTINPKDITGAITNIDMQNIGAGATIDLSYTTGKTWANNQNTVRMIVATGGLTSTEVDNMLIELANVSTWTGSKLIKLTGAGNGARTAASDAAVATLVGKGVTVTTN